MWNRCEAPRGGGEGRFELLFVLFSFPRYFEVDRKTKGWQGVCVRRGGGKGRLLDGDGGGGGGADAIDDHKPDRSKL